MSHERSDPKAHAAGALCKSIAWPEPALIADARSQESDPFLLAAKRTPVDLEAWAVSMMEQSNRRSHLAPQLSPSTRALLRERSSPSSAGGGEPTATPNDLPFGSLSINPGQSSRQPSSRPYPSRTSSANKVPSERNSSTSTHDHAQRGQGYSGTLHQAPGQLNGYAAPEVNTRHHGSNSGYPSYRPTRDYS